MMARKGLGKGMGAGYKNLIVKDPVVHSQSAKGMKQTSAVKPMPSLDAMLRNVDRATKIRYLENIGLFKKEALRQMSDQEIDDLVRVAMEVKDFTREDSDKDGLPDVIDCAPYDKKKQHKITGIRFEGRTPSIDQMETLVSELRERLGEKGYEFNIKRDSQSALDVGNFRISDDYIKSKGYNVSPYSGRRGRYLNWDNWVEVNDTINDVLDKSGVSANVYSLGGKFKVRSGSQRYDEAKWDLIGQENVGSMVQPFARRDAWQPE